MLLIKGFLITLELFLASFMYNRIRIRYKICYCEFDIFFYLASSLLISQKKDKICNCDIILKEFIKRKTCLTQLNKCNMQILINHSLNLRQISLRIKK